MVNYWIIVNALILLPQVNSERGSALFVAAFLIGLREGLEASLIVGILAAFLKRNGSSLRPLIIATVAAVALSVAVAIGLNLFSTALPQAQQEALETIIGIVAVVFVTTMILWMNTNARSMKDSLESSAQSSLSSGGEKAMAGMAFLAIIKEGFETAVFLLAVFQASSAGSEWLGVVGALLGVVIAVVVGYLIYFGGARFNLGTFFKVTGPFLILVAAGFVANCFRTAHEAGWVNIGQLQVLDLSWLIQNDSVVGALLTGMFSIQADPRLIEVLAWAAYLVPVMIVYCWPRKFAFSFERRQLVKRIAAGCCLVAALGLAVFAPRVSTDVAGDTRLVSGSGATTQVTLANVSDDTATLEFADADGQESVELSKVSDGELDGLPLVQWETTKSVQPDESLPTTITLNELRTMNGGRVPSGLNTERTPGPFEVTWAESATYTARTSNTSLLRASCDEKLLATLTGGGIASSKTVSVSAALSDSWAVPDDEVTAAEGSLQEAQLAAEEAKLWWLWCPIALAAVAAGLIGFSVWESHKASRDANAPHSKEGFTAA